MLRLRRGTVVATDPLTGEVAGERRRAWADPSLVGAVAEGDEVIVNTIAVDLALGSGGSDLVHVNLTRGLDARPEGDEHVLKLNYTSLQHQVAPVEVTVDQSADPPPPPVAVIPLHGHLAPIAWAAHEARPGVRLGFVQAVGGALPGGLSRDVAELRDRGLLAGHVTAGPAYGGEAEAITVVGALDAARRGLAWDAVVCGPGPGILGSASRHGHGGMSALDAAHASLALGFPTILSPRISSSDPRPRHRGLSHHTASVLELLLATVRVPVPEIDVEGWPTGDEGTERADLPSVLDSLHEACDDRHDVSVLPVDLDGYSRSGLASVTMGRTIAEDPLFFAAPLAAGRALGEAVGSGGAA